MVRVRKHIYRLHFYNGISSIEQGQVAGLRSGIAAYIHNCRRFYLQYFIDQLFVHAGAGRIGNQYIGAAMLRKKIIVAYINNIATKKFAVANTIKNCIFTCIGYGSFYHFYPNHLLSAAAAKNTNGTRTAIQVVKGLCTNKFLKITANLIQLFTLPAICLKKRFGPDLKLEIFQSFDHVAFTFINLRLQVKKRIVSF